MATGSEDETVFFFSVVNQYQPLSFIQCKSGIFSYNILFVIIINFGLGVTSLSWSAGGQYLLVCCQNGKVIEVTSPPSFLSFDTSVTFEIKLNMREYPNNNKINNNINKV